MITEDPQAKVSLETVEDAYTWILARRVETTVVERKLGRRNYDVPDFQRSLLKPDFFLLRSTRVKSRKLKIGGSIMS